MHESSADRNVVEVLAEEFVERYRQGERPPLSEYTQRYPDIADQIEDLFPALLMMENLKPAEEDEAAAKDRQLSAAALDHLGDYRILREVGRGGMGIVYEAEQVSLGRHVALKVLPKSLLETPKHRMRFEREAKAAAKLHHTNIVPVFGVGQQDDVGYYVMQFIQGLALDEVLDELKRMKIRPSSSSGSLKAGELRVSRRGSSAADVARSLLTGAFQPPTVEQSRGAAGQDLGDETIVQTPASPVPEQQATSDSTCHGRMSDTFSLSDSSVVLPGGAKGRAEKSNRKHTYWESVARIGVQVADALEYAHGQGVLHRDIKPSNLLLDVQGVVWVTDFGLAKLDDDRGLTESGDVLGTLRYMAPETFKGKADARSELYSLGLTLYELLAFRPAFGETNRKTLIDQVLNAEVEPLGKLNPDIPRDLVTIVHKAIERDPGHRYQTAQELADDLQRFVEDEPIKARRVSAIERVARWSRRNRGMAAALAAVCLLLLVINIAGPLFTWWTMSLNQQLEVKQGELSETITQLKSTGDRLQEETKRANDKAKEEEDAKKDALRLRTEAQQQKSFARRNLYTSSLLAAQLSLTRSDGYSRAKELLAELRRQAGEADMRGWEWYYLDAQPPPGGLVLNDFSQYPVAVEFSPDGQYLAASDTSGSVRVFDANSGRLEQTLLGHQGVVSMVGWSPDGTRLASASADHTARIWNLKTTIEELQLVGHTMALAAVAWSPDGKRLVTSSFDGLVKTWDAASGKDLVTIRDHGNVRGLDWSPDGGRLVSGGDDKTVRVWNAETGDPIHVMQGHAGKVGRVRFSPDGRRIASTSWETAEKAVIVWDAEQGTELLTLKNLASGVHGVSWSPDGGRLATAAWRHPGTADVWDADTGENLHSFSGHQSTLYECSWSPDGRRLASASRDGTVRFWTVVKEKPVPEFAGHQDRIRTLAWSRDGSRLATASFDKTVKIWDVAAKRNLFTFDGHKEYVYCVDWNPAGTHLASCGQEQVFHIWEAETGKVLHTISAASSGDINVVAWSPDGTRIATAADDKSVRIFDTEDGYEIQRFELNDVALSVDWSYDGRQLAASSNSGELKVWDVATGGEVASFQKPNQTLWTVRFSQDGGKLAAGGELKPQESIFGDAGGGGEGTLTVWDLNTDQFQEFRGHTATVRSIDWIEDGTRLLSAGHDGKAILWDVAGGGQLLAIDDPDGQAIISARFDPDELQIATAGDAPGVRLWDATASYAAELSPKLLPVLDERIARDPTVDDLMLRGRIHSADGKWDEAAADFQQAAALRGPDDEPPAWIETSWWVAGPYSEPLEKRQPPETQLDPNQPIPSENGSGPEPRYWQREQLSSSQGLNLGRIFAGAQHISAYAMTRVFSSERQSAGLLLGSDDRAQVWLEPGTGSCPGTVIFTNPDLSIAVRDDDVVEITLERGWNTLLVKVTNHTDEHGLFARLSQDPLELARAFDQNEQWDKALTYFDRALEADPGNSSILFSRGRASLKSGRRQLAEESFAEALDLIGENTSSYRTMAGLYDEDAQSLLAAGRSAEAVVSLDRSRELYERVLQGESALPQDAAGLAEVMLAGSQPQWTVVTPSEATGQAGETLIVEEDGGAIFVSGPNPKRAIYTLKFPLDEIGPVTAIRLETLPDARLPHGGAGRYPGNGNFHLAEITAAIETGDDGPEPQLIPIVDALADHFAGQGLSPRQAFDEDPKTRWDTDAQYSMPHWAVFAFPSSVQTADGDLVVTLDSGITPWGRHGLGRFRLSVADEPAAFDMLQRRLAIPRIEDPWERLGAAYAAEGDSARAAEWFDRALEQAPDFAVRRELVKRIAELQTDLSEILGRRPKDPLLLWILAKRQAVAGQAEAAAASFAKARGLAESLLEEQPTEFDLRLVHDVPDLCGVVEQDRFEPLLEGQLAQSTLGVRQQIWARANSAGPWWQQFRRNRELLGELMTQYQAKGLRPSMLSACDVASTPGPDFVTAWTKDGRDCRLELALTRAEFDNLLTTLPAQMQLVSLEEYLDGDSTLLAALWVKQTTPAPWELHERLSTSETVELAASMHSRGFRPTYVNAHPDGQLSTVWVKDDGRTELLLGLTYQDLKRLEWERADDCLPIWIDSHFDGKRRRYSVIVDDRVQGTAWKLTLLEGSAEFQSNFDRLVQSGWKPIATTESPVGRAANVGDLDELWPDAPAFLTALTVRPTETPAQSSARAQILAAALQSQSPADQALADFLAELLLAEAAASSWTVLEPIETTSEGGAEFEQQPDGTVFVSGANPDRDRYTLVFPLPSAGVTALRLETLADERLPHGGSGRSPVNGNFVLGELSLSLRTEGDPASETPLPATWGQADVDGSEGRVFPRALDGDMTTDWTPYPQQKGDHVAVVTFQTPPAAAQEDLQLVVRLDTGASAWPQHGLGRFRLSATNDPSAFEKYRRLFAVSRIEDSWARLGAAYEVLGDSPRASAWFAKALVRTPDFAAKRELVERIDELQAHLGGLLALRPDDPLLLRAQARRRVQAGQAEAAGESLARARRLTEALLAKSPADDALAGFLADLLLVDITHWTVLEPIERMSAGGATLTRLSDDSVLAGGLNPEHDLYTITTATNLQNTTAIRLEALTDDSLPNRGPGRSIGGTFVLDRFKVTGSPGATADSPAEIDLDAACADFVSPDRPIRPGGEWHTVAVGDGGKPHVAVYRLAKPLQSQEGSRLTFEMTFNHAPNWPRLHLGRFRLSVTDDPAAFDTLDRRFAVARIEDPWARLGAAYAADGDAAQAAEWFARSLDRAPDAAARIKIAEQAAQDEAVLAALVELRPKDPTLLAAYGRGLASQGAWDAADASFSKALERYEQLLQSESAGGRTAAVLADGLLAIGQPNWTVLQPVEMNSQSGETLTLQEDGSIFVAGPNPERAIYTLKLPLDGGPVAAIRLETLPDPRLPHGGAGRYPESGNFHVSEFTAAIASGENGADLKPIPFLSVTEDRHPNWPATVHAVIDGSPTTRWDPDPKIPRQAVFVLQSPVQAADGHLIVTLDSGITEWGKHGLGRFRLSTTDALPKWIQSGFWKVGPYPLELATAYPPESNPNPFQPVASVAIEAIELPAELHWQPAEVQRNGRIELGTEIGCNYVLTRVWSAAEQEVALQLGDDDNLRALVNGELRLETKPNRGAAHPGEHAVAATLKPGWNTILLKVRNASEKSNVVLQLSDASDDLIAARRGSRIYQADRLAAAGKADEALTLLTELIDENPKDDTLYAKRAEACQQLKQWEDAVRDWTRALEWNPDDLRYLRERAQILDWRLRRLEEALLDWNRLVELTPEDPNAWRLRSQCYDSLGQTEQAMTDINRAVALSSPGNLWLALRVRGDYLARKGKWQEAADDFNKAFGTEVGQWARFDVYRSQAVLQLMAGNVEGYQAAIDKLDEHLANDANSDRTTALVLAIIATPVEITPERRDRLLQSLERKAPGDDEGLKRWLTAALHYRAGEYQQAADLFAQDATRRGLPAFQLLAAMAQHQLGNQAQAKQLLDETAAWIQRKEDSEAGPAVPANQNWHNWAICNILEREAAALIGGQ